MPEATFKITIKNMKATELPGMDIGGTSDPFVKVSTLFFKRMRETRRLIWYAAATSKTKRFS